MRKIILAITVALIAFSSVKAQAPHEQFIEKYQGIAGELMHEYGIPASVILGVSMVESGHGTSKLAKKFNNFFGIMGNNQNAIKKLGHRSRYKEYESDTASFRHFCEVISKKKFYAKLQGNNDYKAWLKAMKNAGYSEAPSTWEARITTTIKRNKLYELDVFLSDPLNLPVTDSLNLQDSTSTK